jgi:D-glycero-D-manno-heptose 1,7-bisphosphate phosphatase
MTAAKREHSLKYIFIDRDGVINEDRADYVKAWNEFQFIPGSLNALRRLTDSGYRIIVITNQSVINRNMVSPKDLEEIHNNMAKAIADHGGRVESIFFCPHTPDDGCDCRKPAPGLLRQAQAKYHMDLAHTCMIGDSFKDILCARKAGCGKAILVRTGYGKETEQQCLQKGLSPDHIADDLNKAVEWLLDESPQRVKDQKAPPV